MWVKVKALLLKLLPVLATICGALAIHKTWVVQAGHTIGLSDDMSQSVAFIACAVFAFLSKGPLAKYHTEVEEAKK
jgi:hypothetical protein